MGTGCLHPRSKWGAVFWQCSRRCHTDSSQPWKATVGGLRIWVPALLDCTPGPWLLSCRIWLLEAFRDQLAGFLCLCAFKKIMPIFQILPFSQSIKCFIPFWDWMSVVWLFYDQFMKFTQFRFFPLWNFCEQCCSEKLCATSWIFSVLQEWNH